MDLSPEKLLVLFVIAVIVLGPERLPGAARALGRGLAEFRRHTSTLRSEFSDVLSEPRAMMESAAREADLRSELDIRRVNFGDDAGYGDGSSDGPAVDGVAATSAVASAYPPDFEGTYNGNGHGYADTFDVEAETRTSRGLLPPGAPDDPMLN